MPEDITAIQREKINRGAMQGLICTNGMGEHFINGKQSASPEVKANLVMEQGSNGQGAHRQSKDGEGVGGK